MAVTSDPETQDANEVDESGPKIPRRSIRITSWNLNGIRNPFNNEPWKRYEDFPRFFNTLKADIICIQEIKVQRRLLQESVVLVPGFDSFFSLPKHKLGYAGVAVYTRRTKCIPIRAEEGLTGVLHNPNNPKSYLEMPAKEQIGGYPTPEQLRPGGIDAATLDSEGRALVLEFPAFVFIGTYCPAISDGSRQEYRLAFLNALEARVRNLHALGKQVVVAGDLNVSCMPRDNMPAADTMVKEGKTLEDFVSTPERRWLNQLLVGGKVYGERDPGREEPALVDLVRAQHPDTDGLYSCWNTKLNLRYSNRGSRIDYVLCSPSIGSWFKDADIQTEIRGSDHAPVYAVISEIVPFNGEDTPIVDIMSPKGTLVGAVRKRRPQKQDLLPLSGRLYPEFNYTRKITEMFQKKSGLPSSASASVVYGPPETDPSIDGVVPLDPEGLPLYPDEARPRAAEKARKKAEEDAAYARLKAECKAKGEPVPLREDAYFRFHKGVLGYCHPYYEMDKVEVWHRAVGFLREMRREFPDENIVEDKPNPDDRERLPLAGHGEKKRERVARAFHDAFGSREHDNAFIASTKPVSSLHKHWFPTLKDLPPPFQGPRLPPWERDKMVPFQPWGVPPNIPVPPDATSGMFPPIRLRSKAIKNGIRTAPDYGDHELPVKPNTKKSNAARVAPLRQKAIKRTKLMNKSVQEKRRRRTKKGRAADGDDSEDHDSEWEEGENGYGDPRPSYYLIPAWWDFENEPDSFESALELIRVIYSNWLVWHDPVRAKSFRCEDRTSRQDTPLSSSARILEDGNIPLPSESVAGSPESSPEPSSESSPESSPEPSPEPSAVLPRRRSTQPRKSCAPARSIFDDYFANLPAAPPVSFAGPSPLGPILIPEEFQYLTDPIEEAPRLTGGWPPETAPGWKTARAAALSAQVAPSTFLQARPFQAKAASLMNSMSVSASPYQQSSGTPYHTDQASTQATSPSSSQMMPPPVPAAGQNQTSPGSEETQTRRRPIRPLDPNTGYPRQRSPDWDSHRRRRPNTEPVNFMRNRVSSPPAAGAFSTFRVDANTHGTGTTQSQQVVGSPSNGNSQPQQFVASPSTGAFQSQQFVGSSSSGVFQPQQNGGSSSSDIFQPQQYVGPPSTGVVQPQQAWGSPSNGTFQPHQYVGPPSTGISQPEQYKGSPHTGTTFELQQVMGPPSSGVIQPQQNMGPHSTGSTQPPLYMGPPDIGPSQSQNDVYYGITANPFLVSTGGMDNQYPIQGSEYNIPSSGAGPSANPGNQDSDPSNGFTYSSSGYASPSVGAVTTADSDNQHSNLSSGQTAPISGTGTMSAPVRGNHHNTSGGENTTPIIGTVSAADSGNQQTSLGSETLTPNPGAISAVDLNNLLAGPGPLFPTPTLEAVLAANSRGNQHNMLRRRFTNVRSLMQFVPPARRRAPPDRPGSYFLGMYYDPPLGKQVPGETPADGMAITMLYVPNTLVGASTILAAADRQEPAPEDMRPQFYPWNWEHIFSKYAKPKCEHDLDCVALMVRKKGFNCGRSFWICPRPLGPSGQKEYNTMWRCRTFIWCSNWNPLLQPS